MDSTELSVVAAENVAAPQGSAEWHKARLGKITCSRMADMMTNGRGSGSMGLTAYSYMYDLIAEILTGSQQDQIDNAAVRWGHENEPVARAVYALIHGASVVKTGFLVHPHHPHCGGSPDGLVEGDQEGPGGVEIKCPMSSRIHLGYMEGGIVPPQYEWQVDGSMWITQRKWWDFVSFDPRMPEGLQMFRVRRYWNDERMEELSDRVERFWGQLQIKLSKIQSYQTDPGHYVN
jgi:putative phage-type endonuclease